MLLPHMHYYVSLIHENLERWHQGDTGRMKGREHVSSRIRHENPSPRIRQIAQGGVDLGRVALGIMMWIAVGRVVITRGWIRRYSTGTYTDTRHVDIASKVWKRR